MFTLVHTLREIQSMIDWLQNRSIIAEGWDRPKRLNSWWLGRRVKKVPERKGKEPEAGPKVHFTNP